MRLVKLWVLADKLLVHQLQNGVIRAMDKIRINTKVVPVECLSYVCSNTSENSALRRWFVHQSAYELQSGMYSEEPENFPQEILLDIVTTLRSVLPESIAVGNKKCIKEFEVKAPNNEV